MTYSIITGSLNYYSDIKSVIKIIIETFKNIEVSLKVNYKGLLSA